MLKDGRGLGKRTGDLWLKAVVSTWGICFCRFCCIRQIRRKQAGKGRWHGGGWWSLLPDSVASLAAARRVLGWAGSWYHCEGSVMGWDGPASGVGLLSPRLSPALSAASGGNSSPWTGRVRREPHAVPDPAPLCCTCHRDSQTGWGVGEQPGSLGRTSGSRDLVSLLCPFAQLESGGHVCQFGTYILKVTSFF